VNRPVRVGGGLGGVGDHEDGLAVVTAEAAEDGENEIIAFSDHIILKNIEIKTNYQIYNVIGQLVQTGTVMSDISTAKLGKGVYILRLESGKTFKFVK